MSDQSIVTGNDNIVIQGVSDSHITLNVNGETKEIKKELAELKTLMQNYSVQSFKWAQQDYNINELNESNFEFVTKKNAFNEELTKKLIEALQPYMEAAKKIMELAKTKPEWATIDAISAPAQDRIARQYVGVLGIHLRKLIAIGKEDMSVGKQRKYIDNCHLTVRRTIQLVSFALLSKLWDYQKVKSQYFSEEQKKVIKDFFEYQFEWNIPEQLKLFTTLMEIYKTKSLSYPLPELGDFGPHLDSGSPFLDACNQMQEIKSKMQQSGFSKLDCFESEKHLTIVLVAFSFLADYKMISIKNISYSESRNNPPHYLHYFSNLKDSKSKEENKGFKIDDEPIITDGILIYKGEYKESTNLFPFIIDFNSIDEEEGSKICFYNCRDIGDNSLTYVFIEDNSTEKIAPGDAEVSNQDILKILNKEDKSKKDERIAFKKDTVYKQFIDAQKVIIAASEDQEEYSHLFTEEEGS